jgi:hypothetical protein
MPKYTYTLQDQSIAQLPLALWVKRKARDRLPAKIVLEITRSLLAGDKWVPEAHMVEDPEDGGMFCSVLIEHEPNQYEALFRQWDEHAALLDRAVAGDAEAAIEYCKLEKAGKVYHGCFAG